MFKSYKAPGFGGDTEVALHSRLMFGPALMFCRANQTASRNYLEDYFNMVEILK